MSKRARKKMAAQVAGLLTPLQAEIMAVVWDHDSPLSVEEITDEVNALHDQTVKLGSISSICFRLAQRGVLHRVGPRPMRYGAALGFEPFLQVGALRDTKQLLATYDVLAIQPFVQLVRRRPGMLALLQAELDAEETA